VNCRVSELRRGAVVWADLNPTAGREQAGRRPALVVASHRYLATATTLAIVVPVTSVDRGWPNHVLLRGERLELGQASFAMTEQPRTIDRGRIVSSAGLVDAATLREVDTWLRDFLDLPAGRGA
jgi:mRNA interferase MazF